MMMGSIFGVLIGGWIFISQYKHLLVMLLSLEMISLSMLWMMGVWGGWGGHEEFFMLVFLGMVACEGGMGLAILVNLVRSHGSDKFDSISLLVC